VSSAWQRFVDLNRRLCRGMNGWFPSRFAVDGNQDFAASVVPRLVRPGMRVIDVGGGKHPFLSVETKRALGLTVIGIDVAPEELAAAPPGAYDAAIVADICDPLPPDRADLIICNTVIEHVVSTERAMRTLACLVRPGGSIAIFVPCRNAPFARVNLLLPERLKVRILHGIYPETAHFAGFRAYYDGCTPAALARHAENAGLEVVERRLYHWSGYLEFFAPLYLVWRVTTLLAVALFGDAACDRFYLVVRRP
jgi:2-polyprenyl-6-hydroxyphenyl methylase/3-demethylubiquinone-9 3-methyltransferase